MENHPLPPMTDADIRRWMSHQTRNRVGQVAAAMVLEGTDAIRDEDLRAIGEAAVYAAEELEASAQLAMLT